MRRSPFVLTFTTTLMFGLSAPAAPADVRADINTLRAAAGLPAITASDPHAATITQEEAAAPTDSSSARPAPEERWAQAAGTSPTYADTDDGPRFRSAFITWAANLSAAAYAEGDLSLLALILDPRASTLDTASTPSHTAIGVTIDPAGRWSAPIPGQLTVDPFTLLPLRFVIPPGSSDDELRVQEQLGRGPWRSLQQTETLFNEPVALTGGRVLADAFALTDSLAYDSRLRLTFNNAAPSAAVRVTPAPPRALLRRGLTYRRTATATDRRLIGRAIRRAIPAARRLIAKIDGLIDVHITTRSLEGEQGLATITDDGSGRFRLYLNRSALRARRTATELVLHELGHVINYGGFGGPAFTKADKLVPRGGRCRPRTPLDRQGPCAPAQERFADTFTRWALNRRKLNAGYDVRPPRSLSAWGKVLRANFYLRPGRTPGPGPG